MKVYVTCIRKRSLIKRFNIHHVTYTTRVFCGLTTCITTALSKDISNHAKKGTIYAENVCVLFVLVFEEIRLSSGLNISLLQIVQPTRSL
jgi:hypothetical protein